jgi:hypothetical protein
MRLDWNMVVVLAACTVGKGERRDVVVDGPKPMVVVALEDTNVDGFRGGFDEVKAAPYCPNRSRRRCITP